MPECTNLAENYDIITLVTIMMLLVTITTISQHSEDPGIVKTVYSGIFRNMQSCSFRTQDIFKSMSNM